MLELIAFDADDTLWRNEDLYVAAQSKFRDLLSSYHSPEWVDRQLYQTEMRNLQHFGYGIKAFMLSMIETAVELTEGRIQGHEIQRIIEFGKEMLQAETCLLEGVEATIARLAETYPLMVITKGDLLDQEAKLARSGLAGYFKYVEVVSDKTGESYRRILARHAIAPERFLMVGNSLKSDILPVVALGGRAVYIPYANTWVHETVPEAENGPKGYATLERIALLPDLLDQMEHA